MPVLPQPLSLNLLKDMAKVDKVDYSADLDNLYSKMDDFEKFFRTGKVSCNMLRYIPGLGKVGYQGQLHSAETKSKYADDTFKNKKVIEFNVLLTKRHYTNFQNDHLCFPLKIKLAADNNNNITEGVITVNNFVAHWIKEKDIKRYGDDVPILPLTYTVDIYRCSDEIVKHIPKDVLKTILNYLLYSKKKVANYGTNNNRRTNYMTSTATAGNRTHKNLTDRIAKSHEQLKNEHVYRIAPELLCGVGLVNQCFKFNTKYILTL